MKIAMFPKIYKKISTFFLIAFILWCVYLVRLPLILSCLMLYSSIKSNPHADRIIAEFHLSLSTESAAEAKKYFQSSLQKYLVMYNDIESQEQHREYSKNSTKKKSPLNKKYFIAYLIGNAYECGKGTNIDLDKAKYWYEKSTKNYKYPQAEKALKRVERLAHPKCEEDK